MEPGPQFEQLPMFMTAHELRHTTMPADFPTAYIQETQGQPAPAAAHWANKLEEAKETGLHESIGQNGVKQPVEMLTRDPANPHGVMLLRNGHHRVASSYEHEPRSLLPVRFRE